MAAILVLYHTPSDPGKFDSYYHGTHVPIAKKIPGLQRYSVSKGGVSAFDGSTSPYHMVAILEFNTIADLQAATTTPELQAAAGDLANFADGGVTIFAFDADDV